MKNNINTPRLQKMSFIAIWVGFAIMLAAIGLFLWNGTYSTSLPIDESKFGNFGSLISGIVGSIWSLAGIFLFYLALQEQRGDFETNKNALTKQVEALNHQVKEFKLQRQEVIQTRKVYEEQAETQRVQRFEMSFFHMVNLHHEIVNSMVLRGSNYRVDRQGRDCFETLFKKVKRTYDQHKNSPENDPVRIYLDVFGDYQAAIGHYFRNLYHIYKFINEADLENKGRYAALVRAQLSTYELLLLFYNCLSEHGIEKFKLLIEGFSVFKNLNLRQVLGGHSVIRKYKPKAYKWHDYKKLDTIPDTL